MKISRILIVLPDLNGGGAERLHVLLANAWRAQGIRVDFALMQRRGELLQILPADVGVVDLAAERIRDVVGPLSRHLRSARPDVVLAAMWPLTTAVIAAWLLALRPGRLFVSDHVQLTKSCEHELNIRPNTAGAIIRLSYPFASGAIAVSEGVKQDLCSISGLAPAKFEVIYNPAATGASAERATAEERRRLWGDGFDHHILAVGRLKAQKDHATLIRAFGLLPIDLNAKMTIVGDGPLRAELLTFVEELGLTRRIAFAGFVLDPYPWYRSADLFVLSSQWEGFGNVIVEALECGLPVVSTDCPSGPSEILAGGRYGRLVTPQQPQEMASAIGEALALEWDRSALRERAADFSVEVAARRHLAYFERDQ